MMPVFLLVDHDSGGGGVLTGYQQRPPRAVNLIETLAKMPPQFGKGADVHPAISHGLSCPRKLIRGYQDFSRYSPS